MTTSLVAQTTIPLYSGEIPGAKPGPDDERTEEQNGITVVHNITRPSIAVYLPEKSKATGTAVIIFPGGGYRINAIRHEGYDVAKKLNEIGIAAFVVKYRIPDDARMTDKRTGALQDAQQAITVVRKNAAKYNVKSDRIGILGFSAGGHLTSTAGTHFDHPVQPSEVSVRPDFMILIYPVISMKEEITHGGSRENLLGKSPAAEDVELYSNELQVNSNTPPTFLVHAQDDDVVKVENSLRFYDALVKNNVKAEMHVYQKGGHGFGLVNKRDPDLWLERCKNWMISNDLLK